MIEIPLHSSEEGTCAVLWRGSKVLISNSQDVAQQLADLGSSPCSNVFRAYLTRNNAPIVGSLLYHGYRGYVGCPHFVQDMDTKWADNLAYVDPLFGQFLWTVASMDSPIHLVASLMACRSVPLRRHPAWPALSFLGSGTTSLVDLLLEIGDVQWYRQVNRPNRSNLTSFFGVRKSQITALYEGRKTPTTARLATLLAAWYNERATGNLNFLCRDIKGLNQKAGIIHGCRRLLSFIRLVWEDNLSSHVEVRFDPERFFKNRSDVRSWQEHMKKIRGR